MSSLVFDFRKRDFLFVSIGHHILRHCLKTLVYFLLDPHFFLEFATEHQKLFK